MTAELQVAKPKVMQEPVMLLGAESRVEGVGNDGNGHDTIIDNQGKNEDDSIDAEAMSQAEAGEGVEKFQVQPTHATQTCLQQESDEVKGESTVPAAAVAGISGADAPRVAACVANLQNEGQNSGRSVDEY